MIDKIIINCDYVLWGYMDADIQTTDQMDSKMSKFKL